jgi:hypothetical protein
MVRYKIIAFVVLLASLSVQAQEAKYSVGGGFGLATLAGGYPPRYTYSPEYRLGFEATLKEHLRLNLRFSYQKIHNDTLAITPFTIGSDESYRTRSWVGNDLTAMLKYHRPLLINRLEIFGGLGAGVTFWDIVDSKIDTVLKTQGEKGETVEMSASEITVSALVGIGCLLSDRWKLSLDGGLMYLTEVGTSFSESFNKTRDRWIVRGGLTLNFLFGGDRWPKRKPLVFDKPIRAVSDDSARQIDTTLGAMLSVVKQKETVPQTLPEENNPLIMAKTNNFSDLADYHPIDQFGAPVDSDCDGYPDYMDHCPYNIVGSAVDSAGCPYDIDNDGIPEGFDCCSNSETGYAIDNYGCLDLNSLEKLIRLEARYQAGTFEIDPDTKKQLLSIARIMRKARSVEMEINAYADEMPTRDENVELSQRRANRVRDYLVGLGIEMTRLKPKGRGSAGLKVAEKNKNDLRMVRPIELKFIK